MKIFICISKGQILSLLLKDKKKSAFFIRSECPNILTIVIVIVFYRFSRFPVKGRAQKRNQCCRWVEAVLVNELLPFESTSLVNWQHGVLIKTIRSEVQKPQDRFIGVSRQGTFPGSFYVGIKRLDSFLYTYKYSKIRCNF